MKNENLKDTKIWIGGNLDLSARVQSIAFSLGLKWASGAAKEITRPVNFITFDEAYGGERIVMRYSRAVSSDDSTALRVFSENTNSVITISEIESMNEWKPNPGDSVVCISLEGFPSEGDSKFMEADGLVIGGIYTIARAGDYHSGPCVGIENSVNGYSHPAACFKPAKSEVPNFISPRMEESTRIVKATDIQVGDYLHISKAPIVWDGVLCDNSPLYLKYPQILRVDKIQVNNSEYISADVGGYGFCLHELVKDKVVRRAYAHELPADVITSMEHDEMASAAIRLLRGGSSAQPTQTALYRFCGAYLASSDPACYDPTNLVISGVTKAITQKVPDKIRIEEIPMLRVPGNSPTAKRIQQIRLHTPAVYL
jgi:hypothetical protein